MENIRPIVIISRCIGFESCRYDGTIVSCPFIKRLGRYVDYIPVCPEVEIGLGIPREPILIVRKGGTKRLVQPATGIDLTEKTVDFSNRFLSSIDEVDGFILKDRSPSCGIRGVKIFRSPDAKPHSGKGSGFFGSIVTERFQHHAITGEDRLRDLTYRENFLTKLFTLARFRDAESGSERSGIEQFHSNNALLLTAYSKKGFRTLGKILENRDRKPEAEVVSLYADVLYSALRRPPRFASNIEIILQALGHFSCLLTHEEKGYFLETMERYRERKVPLSSLLLLISVWIKRFRIKELSGQTYFSPYPGKLLNITDSAADRGCRQYGHIR